MVKPSSHWESHSSTAAGVSGPVNGVMIFDAIVFWGVFGRGCRGWLLKGCVSVSDSSSEKLSGVGGRWDHVRGPRGLKNGRGYVAVDCLVN